MLYEVKYFLDLMQSYFATITQHVQNKQHILQEKRTIK